MSKSTKEKKKDFTSYLLQGIPIHAYRVFQSKCTLQGKKVKEVLLEFIHNYGR